MRSSFLSAFLIGLRYFFTSLQVDWSGRWRDSCGTSGQVRPLTAQSGKGLTGRPAESEAPGAEINYFQKKRFFYNPVTKSAQSFDKFRFFALHEGPI